MKLAHSFLSCLLLCTLPLTAVAQHGVLKQVVPGVWFREGEMELSYCNNAVIEIADHLVVVDANYPSGARALIDDIKKISTKPIKYVIDTHADADRAYGDPIFCHARRYYDRLRRRFGRNETLRAEDVAADGRLAERRRRAELGHVDRALQGC
jgi:glyoxylase-like metal-dependent hydrolase (beta-lactamase superfamily II)